MPCLVAVYGRSALFRREMEKLGQRRQREVTGTDWKDRREKKLQVGWKNSKKKKKKHILKRKYID